MMNEESRPVFVTFGQTMYRVRYAVAILKTVVDRFKDNGIWEFVKNDQVRINVINKMEGEERMQYQKREQRARELLKTLDQISPKIVYSNNGHILFWCQKKDQQMLRELCLTKYFKRDRKCRACLGLKLRQHWPEQWNKKEKGGNNRENVN